MMKRPQDFVFVAPATELNFSYASFCFEVWARRSFLCVELVVVLS